MVGLIGGLACDTPLVLFFLPVVLGCTLLDLLFNSVLIEIVRKMGSFKKLCLFQI